MRRHVAADFGRRILPVAQRPTHVHTPAARTHHECTAPHNSEQYRGTSCAIFGQFSHASTARVSKFTRRSISVQFRKLYRAGTVPPQLIVCVTKFTRRSISVQFRKLYRAGTVPPQLIVCVTKFTRRSISVQFRKLFRRMHRPHVCQNSRDDLFPCNFANCTEPAPCRLN